jgi:hypothetical protein
MGKPINAPSFKNSIPHKSERELELEMTIIGIAAALSQNKTFPADVRLARSMATGAVNRLGL